MILKSMQIRMQKQRFLSAKALHLQLKSSAIEKQLQKSIFTIIKS